MVATIKKWGNSFALRIPKKLLDRLELGENGMVEIEVDDGKLIVKPLDRLDTLLGQINEENRHEEIDFGAPQGKEIW